MVFILEFWYSTVEMWIVHGEAVRGLRLADRQPSHVTFPFPCTAIFGQQEPSTLDPSGAGSQSLCMSQQKRF